MRKSGDEHISKIEEFKFKKARNYDSSLEYSKVRNVMVSTDEEKLKQTYLVNMQPVEEIVSIVKQKTSSVSTGFGRSLPIVRVF